MTSILLRVEAGPAIGLGHLGRCLSLAAALGELGADCRFLTPPDAAVRARVEAAGYGWTALESGSGSADDARQTGALAAAAAAVVVDSYLVDAAYFAALRAASLRVLAIDDHADFPHPAHIVVSSAGEHLPYRSAHGDTVFLLGPRYAPLQPEFWQLPEHGVSPVVRNVLVTLGGSDPQNVMPSLMRALDSLPGGYEIAVVAGPFFTNERQIQQAAASARHPVRLLCRPASLVEPIIQADIAVTAGGTTLFELACAGVPAAVIQVAENQVANIRTFVERGLALPAGSSEDGSIAGQAASAVQLLGEDVALRQRMSAAGRRTVDGQGARRVAQLLLAAAK